MSMSTEQTLIQKMAPEDRDSNARSFTNRGYDLLTAFQKLEVFDHSTSQNHGEEIAGMSIMLPFLRLNQTT